MNNLFSIFLCAILNFISAFLVFLKMFVVLVLTILHSFYEYVNKKLNIKFYKKV
jgi:hypothetical protein